jgi:HPt (histidine-containing phosphotransfer) domain-containing protein
MNFKELGANLGLEEDEYRELIDLFIQSGGTDLQNLAQAIAARDADLVVRSAHTIKGASGNLGLTEVSAAAKTIEERAMRNQLDDLTQALQALENHFQVIRAFVGQ